jgi:hypothetical protein
MLTHHNATMAYGIDTIEGAARVIHRDLHSSTTTVNSAWARQAPGGASPTS